MIKSLLNVTDSRFQEKLLNQAKAVKKIEPGYIIPDQFCNNYPQRLEKTFPAGAAPYLERMQLDKPVSRQEKLMQKIVLFALKQAGQL